MNKILKRDDYIKEVYEPMMEQKEYEELVSINEGLLKNLFGIAKNLFRKDWDSIKCENPEIINVYKELDDSLTGFSMMKLSKKKECNQVRQELVDFAYDWYEKKMNDAKKDDVDPVPAKGLKFKDETLQSNIDATKEKINDICGEDEQMKKWANILMRDMKVVINRSIIADIDDENTKKEIEKENKEYLKKQKEVNKEMEKFQNEQLKEIQKERETLISNVEASPMKPEDLLGDKAIQNIYGEFKKIRDNKDLIKSDQTLGLKTILGDAKTDSKEFKTTFKLMDSFYTALNTNDVMKKFNETPGQSVQAMCIAVNAFIKNCVYNDSDYGKALPLMAKCAVISDGTVSYNLPLNDKEGDDAGNYFTDIINIITTGQLKDTKGNEIKLPDNFKTSSKTLLNKIVSEAKKLKETADKNYNEKLKKLNDEM